MYKRQPDGCSPARVDAEMLALFRALSPEAYEDVYKRQTFTNAYSTKGSVALKATKKLTGGTLESGQFSFELRDKAGKVVQTVTNDADGSVTFEPISYDAAGTYNYTIAEVVPGQGSVCLLYTSRRILILLTSVCLQLIFSSNPFKWTSLPCLFISCLLYTSRCV